jgi:hypothetical protein
LWKISSNSSIKNSRRLPDSNPMRRFTILLNF